ncbi:MAG: hypothetical protein ABIH52_03385 [Candidatus Aenigmatarchaeota archaeon]
MLDYNSRVVLAADVFGLPKEKVFEILNGKFGITEQNGVSLLTDPTAFKEGQCRQAFCEDESGPKIGLAVFNRGFHLLTQPEKPSDEPAAEDTEEKSFLDKLGLGDKSDQLMLWLAGGGGSLADLINPIELISHYRPNEPRNPVTQIMKKAFGNKPVIAFKPGTAEVAVAETKQYITELDQGHDEKDAIMVDGTKVRLMPVGVLPFNYVDACPLHGESLRSGVCDQTDTDFNGVDTRTRQLIAVISHRNEAPNDLQGLMTFIDTAKKGFDALAAIFKNAAMDFAELSAADNLPKLKVQLRPSKKLATPFHDDDAKFHPFGQNSPLSQF